MKISLYLSFSLKNKKKTIMKINQSEIVVVWKGAGTLVYMGKYAYNEQEELTWLLVWWKYHVKKKKKRKWNEK